MRNCFKHWMIPVWLGLGCLAGAQEKRPPTAAVQGIKGVKEDAVARVKAIETDARAVPQGSARGVNKVDGINTINGVKADGRTVILPPPPTKTTPPPRPPPPPVAVKGTAVNVGSGTVGNLGSIRAIRGVAGISTPKLQNLEAALLIKQDGGGTPAGGGAEKGGKGKAAAAALLGAPGPAPKPGPKADGRESFQEFVTPPKTGS